MKNLMEEILFPAALPIMIRTDNDDARNIIKNNRSSTKVKPMFEIYVFT